MIAMMPNNPDYELPTTSRARGYELPRGPEGRRAVREMYKASLALGLMRNLETLEMTGCR